MASLFPTNSGSSGSGGGGNVLISFKAGKCNIGPIQSNGKHAITPDIRKGTVSLVKGADQLVYLKWTDRSSNRAEDERMVFPDELKCLKVKTGRDNDRIHLLKYNTGQLFLMFWMQDKASDKDKDNCKRLNELLNNPNAAASSSGAVSTTTGAGAGAGGRLGSDQLMQMLGMSLPNAQPPVSQPVTAAPVAPVNNMLANLDFSSLLAVQPTQPAPSAGSNIVSSRQRPLGLEDILTADSILDTGIMDDPEVVASLLQFLPEDQRTQEHLEETLRSPQFRQSLTTLSSALQSDNFNNVMMNFNIDPAPGMQHLLRNDAIGAFIAALQATVDAQNRTESESGSNPPSSE